MGEGLKRNGTRAFVAVTAVCAALSPAALAAVGGVSTERHDAWPRGPVKLARVGGGGVSAPAAGIARGFAGHGRLIGTPPVAPQ
jgi:hypothetical protein